MTHEDMTGIAEALEDKARSVREGFYGEQDRPGDDLRWEGDLLSAAGILRSGKLEQLDETHLEEIACCTGDDDANAIREALETGNFPRVEEEA